MTPDDKRHGERAGYYAHRRDGEDACAPCKRAAARAEATYEYARNQGRPYSHPPHTVSRRIRALVAIGWTHGDIGDRLGVSRSLVQAWERGNLGHVNASTAVRVRAVYAELSMTPAPDSYGARRSLARAARLGFASPLAWDDIDHDEAPTGMRQPRTEYDGRDLIDPATVLRILAGEVLPANAAERGEVVRRWKAAGESEAALCTRMGWHEGRYGREAESA